MQSRWMKQQWRRVEDDMLKSEYLCKSLVSMIMLLGFAQAVEYEGLHKICFDCGKYSQKKISAQTQKQNPL